MTEQVATNVHWHDGLVTREERMSCLKQRGGTVWFTGLSASGKSTIAVALEQVLCNQGNAVYRLDGDNVRQGLNKNLGFSAEDRAENIRRIGEVCKLFSDAGLVTLASFISPYKADRDLARTFHEEAGIPFLECYVEVPLDVAEERDPKGLYKKARAGEIKGFTGIDDPYEAPENAELVIPTADQSLEESVTMVLEGIRANGLIE